MRALGRVWRRLAPIRVIGDKGTSRVRGPPGTERARIRWGRGDQKRTSGLAGRTW